MHAHGLGAVLAAFLIYRCASASPVTPRGITDPALKPWVSVGADGTLVATITPALTSINGAATTINAAPASLTETTTTSQSDSKPTDASNSGGGAYYPCTSLVEGYICSPANESTVYVGTTYYVTWNSDFIGHQDKKNASVYVMADYVNTTGGPIAFQSPPTSVSTGFYALTIQKEWLQDRSSNNITLHINLLDPEPDGQRVQGPTLVVTNAPGQYYRQPSTESPTGQSLYIALPIAFGFVLLCVCGGYFLNKKHRQIGIGNVMGRRSGYGVGKSRGQRLGLGKREKGGVQLRDQVPGSDGRYHDASIGEEQRGRQGGSVHTRADSDLGSLVGSPTPPRTNYFRDEMRRQERQGY